MVERQPSKLNVAGSSPVSRSREIYIARVAQSVEHVLGKDGVVGSSPIPGFDEIRRGKALPTQARG